jgi:hypothetical protein
MRIKYVVLCYVQHWGYSPSLRKEIEFTEEPTNEQIEKALSEIQLGKYDYETDYSSGAVLPDYRMPKKCRVRRIYAVVEKRLYREVEING